MQNRKTQTGFTLIELMIVIMVTAILLAIAAPSFQPLIERWRVRQGTSAFEGTIYLARSEAFKRGGGVVIAKLPNGTNGCTLAPTADEWSCGWQTFIDANGNGALDASEQIVQTVSPPKNTNFMMVGMGAALRVDRWGQFSGLSSLRMVVSPHPAGISSPGTRTICVSAGGRIRVVDGDPVCT